MKTLNLFRLTVTTIALALLTISCYASYEDVSAKNAEVETNASADMQEVHGPGTYTVQVEGMS
ncbi:MAG: hypothetical protein V3W41_10605 [Planctomycetota bacterium]